ncbi:energy-coupling factor transporter transmembrane component T [Mycobacterium sp. BMJ-28]
MSRPIASASGTALNKDAICQRFREPQTLHNRIRDCTPGTIFVVVLSMAVVAASRDGYWWKAAMCVAYLVLAYMAGVGTSFLLAFLRLGLVVGGILFVARSLVLPGEHVLLTIGALKVSRESIDGAGRFALVVVVISGAVILLFKIVPMKNMMQALESSGLTPRATFVVLASIQSITSLGEHSRIVSEAQESRGIEMGGSLPRKVKAFFSIVAPVFLAAISETEERALALDARAFNASNKHTHLVQMKPASIGQRIAALACLTLAVLSVLGAVTSWS